MSHRISLAIAIALTVSTVSAAEEKAKKKQKASNQITVSKQTTYVTGPLRDDGSVDFAGAINARFGAGVTPNKNANVLYWQALGPRPERTEVSQEMFKLLGMKRPAADGEVLQNIVQFARPQGRNSKEAMKQLETAMASPWKGRQLPLVAAWLAKNEVPLRIIVEGSRRPQYFQPIIADRDNGLIAALLPSVQALRTAGRALVARAMMRLGEGKDQMAWNDLQAAHRLGRHVSHGSTLIESLVGIAIDGIAAKGDAKFFAHCRPDPKQARRYLKQAQSLPPMAPMADRVTFTERLMFIDSTCQVAEKGLDNFAKILDVVGDGSAKSFRGPIGKMAGAIVDWDIVAKNGNDWYDRLDAAMNKKYYAARQRALNKIAKDLTQLGKNSKTASVFALLSGNGKVISKSVGDILVAMLVPAVTACQRAADRFEQTDRQLVLAAALHVYRSEKGKYPDRLPQLSPGILKELPTDLFTNGNLIYRPRPTGYLLYSVGPNRKDDGGKGRDEGSGTDDLRIKVSR